MKIRDGGTCCWPDFFAHTLQTRAGLSATLRGQPGLALPSKKIKKPLRKEKKKCE